LTKLGGESLSLTDLGPGAAHLQPDAVFDLVVLDNATDADQEVRCQRSLGETTAATDPMPWIPYTIEGVGTWYPKRGDRAIALHPVDGPPVIVAWWPAPDAPPDVSA